MRVSDLPNGQVVRARWERYRDNMTYPDWCPWQDVRLDVQRNRRGEVVVVTLLHRGRSPREEG
jgi:hypothetical protein